MNNNTEGQGKLAPVFVKENGQMPTEKVPPTIVSCHPKRGWVVVEGVL
jgi:hypothetical protein